MVKDRTLVVIGMIVLVGMLLTAAFALGVYIVEHGWTRQGLQYQPGAGKQPPAPQGGKKPPLNGEPPARGQPPANQRPPQGSAQPGGLPPGRPQVVGLIRVVALDALELATGDGRRLVHLLPVTRYAAGNGEPLRLEDLKIGGVVGVYGWLVDGPPREFIADVVVLLLPK
jgi:hypothetical protein